MSNKDSAIVLILNDACRVVKAQYEEDAPAEYFKTFDPDVAEDDLVVVETSSCWGMTVVKVTEVDVTIDYKAPPPVRWIVHRIDHDRYDELLEQERVAIDAVNRSEQENERKRLKAQMKKDHEEAIAALAITKAE